MKYSALLIFAFINKALAAVTHLSEANFDSIVDGSTNVLVEFYAPWCGHCKNLAPEYKAASDVFTSADEIVIADLDATEAESISTKYGIEGFPTLKFFAKGSTEPEEYSGGRTADTIVEWVNGKIGTNRKIKKVPSPVTVLTSKNFDELVLGEKAALVKFYAPWCGHCKSMAPAYEALATAFKEDKNVVIGHVDATKESELGTRFDIEGFPTLKYFPAGSSEPLAYEGARDVFSMVNWVNENFGTARNPDGTLKPTAGRMDSLDALIKAAKYEVTQELVDTLKEHVKPLAGDAAESGKRYVAAAEKILAKGADFVVTEQKRLKGMLFSPNVKHELRSGMQYRMNTLAAFEKP